MATIVVLDAGPLWLATMSRSRPEATQCHEWLDAMEYAGVTVLISAVTDYEVRRGLRRRNATSRLRTLRGLLGRFDYFPLTTPAWERAADVWAYVRQLGVPTADDASIDGDAILAGVALTVGQPGDTAVIATNNVRHLARFPGVDARDWRGITV